MFSGGKRWKKKKRGRRLQRKLLLILCEGRKGKKKEKVAKIALQLLSSRGLNETGKPRSGTSPAEKEGREKSGGLFLPLL